MAYRKNKMTRSRIARVEVLEGETIEDKVERLVENKEPIKDGAPEIYTERKDGVLSAYNIRTDRWEIAAEAMDKIEASRVAKRENTGKVVDMEGKEKTEETKTEGKKVDSSKANGESGA